MDFVFGHTDLFHQKKCGPRKYKNTLLLLLLLFIYLFLSLNETTTSHDDAVYDYQGPKVGAAFRFPNGLTFGQTFSEKFGLLYYLIINIIYILSEKMLSFLDLSRDAHLLIQRSYASITRLAGRSLWWTAVNVQTSFSPFLTLNK